MPAPPMRGGNVIEILVQLALASQAEGERPRATDLLGRALALGEPEGHIRVFLDAGPALSAVLHSVAPDTPGGRHARAVLAAGAQEPPRPDRLQRHPYGTGTASRRLAQRA